MRKNNAITFERLVALIDKEVTTHIAKEIDVVDLLMVVEEKEMWKKTEFYGDKKNFINKINIFSDLCNMVGYAPTRYFNVKRIFGENRGRAVLVHWGYKNGLEWAGIRNEEERKKVIDLARKYRTGGYSISAIKFKDLYEEIKPKPVKLPLIPLTSPVSEEEPGLQSTKTNGDTLRVVIAEKDKLQKDLLVTREELEVKEEQEEKLINTVGQLKTEKEVIVKTVETLQKNGDKAQKNFEIAQQIIDGLKKENAELKAENKRLQKENERLQELLSVAEELLEYEDETV